MKNQINITSSDLEKVFSAIRMPTSQSFQSTQQQKLSYLAWGRLLEKFKLDNIAHTSDNIYSEIRYFAEMNPSNEVKYNIIFRYTTSSSKSRTLVPI